MEVEVNDAVLIRVSGGGRTIISSGVENIDSRVGKARVQVGQKELRKAIGVKPTPRFYYAFPKDDFVG